MCMHTIHEAYHPPKRMEPNGIGYKIFKRILIPVNDKEYRTEGYKTLFYGWDDTYQIGDTYHDLSDKILFTTQRSGSRKYSSGFHIFKNKLDAVEYAVAGGNYGYPDSPEVVIMVECNDIVADGVDGSVDAVVARTMKLIREVN